VKHTGQDKVNLEQALDRDTWLTAAEAKAFGVVDEVITKKPRDAANETQNLASSGPDPFSSTPNPAAT